MDEALRAPEGEVWVRVTNALQAKDGVGDVEIELCGRKGDGVLVVVGG